MSVCRKDDKDYALKQIEGTGISMSACREIAVSISRFKRVPVKRIFKYLWHMPSWLNKFLEIYLQHVDTLQC